MNTMTSQLSRPAELVRSLPIRQEGAARTTPSLYQRVSQFHENTRILEFSTTWKGNVLLWMVVALILSIPRYLPLLPVMILAQIFPAHRLWIVGLGAGSLFLHTKLVGLEVTEPLWMAVDAGIIVGVLYLFFRVARAFSSLPRVVRNSPQMFLHLLLWSCILALVFLPSGFRDLPAWAVADNLSVCLVFFSFLIWRIGFMLYSGRRGSIKQSRFVDHLIYCLPYLGSTQVPYGKGLDYLLQKQADSRLDLAKSQLAGLKLLLLASLWHVVLYLLDTAFFGSRGQPLYLKLYHMDALVGLSASLPAMKVVWASLIVDMIYETMQLAIVGHMIVGSLRLCGFHVFRNTYKPLLATSLVDFWNRYYYYFKELLVEFFFYPTYLSFFKKNHTLRIFAATMMSAFLGNIYYHVLQNFDSFIGYGALAPFTKFSSYFFYSFVLGFGIFVSMLREKNQRGKARTTTSPVLTILLTLRKIAGVWLFFSILRIWDHPGSSFMQDTTFFFALFGVSL
ncbi:MAG: hypothetical protein HQL88_00825 [Magnetococcales bacterium]|nr:hypothetical protein [Magnetococcales bacterium]